MSSIIRHCSSTKWNRWEPRYFSWPYTWIFIVSFAVLTCWCSLCDVNCAKSERRAMLLFCHHSVASSKWEMIWNRFSTLYILKSYIYIVVKHYGWKLMASSFALKNEDPNDMSWLNSIINQHKLPSNIWHYMTHFNFNISICIHCV